MGDNTGIEWTDATWNPIVGCSVVSPGCTNCYAMKFAGNRLDGNPKSPHYAGTTTKSKAGPVWSGKLALAPQHIVNAPLKWSKPRRIFVNSMGDLFHESVPDEWILDALTIMAIARRHTFQVLTKRAERMRDFMSNPDLLQEIMVNWWSFDDGMRSVEAWPLPNVWLGVSAEDQCRADERIPLLLETPAAVRFVSAEPLLGPIDLEPRLGTHMSRVGDMTIYEDGSHTFQDTETPRILRGPDWIIVGGESGPNARPMHPDWARSLRDQCAAAGVPFFFKQWGEWKSYKGGTHFMGPAGTYRRVGSGPQEDDICIAKVGKSRAGRLLDGREHNDMPEVRR
jgi:protein gp37